MGNIKINYNSTYLGEYMGRLEELIDRKFLKDIEFLELEDFDNVIECIYMQFILS